MFEFGNSTRRTSSPFKFFEGWLTDPTFLELVKEKWVNFLEPSQTPSTVHFVENLKGLKLETKSWAKEKKQKDDQSLKEIEHKLNELQDGIDRGYLFQDTK